MLTLCIKHIPNINQDFGIDYDLVLIPRYYILVSYRSQNYGIEPSLSQRHTSVLNYLNHGFSIYHCLYWEKVMLELARTPLKQAEQKENNSVFHQEAGWKIYFIYLTFI